MVAERYALVQKRRAPPWNGLPSEKGSLGPLGGATDAPLQKMLWLLCSAAGALLLIACANVVNLELASSAAAARRSAITLALGASRGHLIGVLILEGALMIGAAVTLAAVIATQGLTLLQSTLPTSISAALVNPLDLDVRACAFMAAVSSIAWLLTSLPVALTASRVSVLDAIRSESRSTTGSRAHAVVRRALTVAEIGISMALLIASLLSARSYASLLAIPKGFDAAGVVGIDMATKPGTTEPPDQLRARVLTALRAAPFVRYVGAVTANPPGGGGSISGKFVMNGRAVDTFVTAAGYGVEPDYFRAMDLRMLEGRAFTDVDPPNSVVIDEALAQKYWPAGHAVGTTIGLNGVSIGGIGDVVQAVGVAAHLRNSADAASHVSATTFPLYYRLGHSATMSLVARISDPARLDDLKSIVRAQAPSLRVRAEFLRDRYARIYANEMLAAYVMNIFGAIALVVAIAGIYSVMTFMVASRLREIGVRMALGADRRQIRSMVFRSSLTMVLAGAGAGVAAALVGARWGASLLFGVSARDPWIYSGVAALVIVTALLATWRPAAAASRVDPSTLLRSS